MEIERKWLMNAFPEGAALPCEMRADVRQGYISTAPAVRIRESVPQGGAASYVLCFKGKGTLAREEIELALDRQTFQRLCVFTGQDLVTKRYRVYRLPGGEALEVSLVDEGRPTAFYYAEVEFPSVAAAHAFVPPACLAPLLGEEQTENPAFSMSAYWRKTRVQPIANSRNEL
ncbi:MAG: CYTH domain-containing protein [Ruthenibacterium sp.]